MKNKIILGTAQFGLDYGINNQSGKVTDKDINQILNYAFENGIKELDTASAYGNSEVLIGSFIKKNPKKIFNINTKISSKKESLEFQIRKSLNRLEIDRINKLLFHSIDLYFHFKNELIEFYSKNKGVLFMNIGVSVYTNYEIQSLLNEEFISTLQAPFNLFDNYFQRGEVFEKAYQNGKTIDVRSVFLQGLFFKKEMEFKKELKPLVNYLKKIKNISLDSGYSIESLALGYVKSFNFVDKILIGVDSIYQLKRNLNQFKLNLPNNIKNKIDLIKIKDINLLNPSMW